MDDNYVGRDDSCACPNFLMLNVEDHMSGAQGSYFYRQFVFLTTAAFAHGETQTLFNSPARRWFCGLAQMTTLVFGSFKSGQFVPRVWLLLHRCSWYRWWYYCLLLLAWLRVALNYGVVSELSGFPSVLLSSQTASLGSMDSGTNTNSNKWCWITRTIQFAVEGSAKLSQRQYTICLSWITAPPCDYFNEFAVIFSLKSVAVEMQLESSVQLALEPRWATLPVVQEFTTKVTCMRTIVLEIRA